MPEDRRVRLDTKLELRLHAPGQGQGSAGRRVENDWWWLRRRALLRGGGGGRRSPARHIAHRRKHRARDVRRDKQYGRGGKAGGWHPRESREGSDPFYLRHDRAHQVI